MAYRVFAPFRRASLAAIAVLLLGSCGSNSPGSPDTLSCNATPANGEAPLAVKFSAEGKDADENAYSWVFSDGSAASGKSVTRTFANGIFTGRVTMRSTGETCQTGRIAVGAPVRLNCTAAPSQLIAPGDVTFDAQAAGGDNTFSYAWDFGDGATSGAKNPVHRYQNPGNYQAKVTATSAGFSTTCIREVRAFKDGVNVSCSADPTQGDAPLKVSFRGSASGGSGTYTYLWQFGDGASSNGKVDSHTYAAKGVYDATFTAESAGAAGVCRQQIFVDRQPICGDNFVDSGAGEECDDGNLAAGDGCTGGCKVEVGWVCTGKRSRCDGICGDGLIRGTEECDDFDVVPGDGCNAQCDVEQGFTCTGEPSTCV